MSRCLSEICCPIKARKALSHRKCMKKRPGNASCILGEHRYLPPLGNSQVGTRTCPCYSRNSWRAHAARKLISRCQDLAPTVLGGLKENPPLGNPQQDSELPLLSQDQARAAVFAHPLSQGFEMANTHLGKG